MIEKWMKKIGKKSASEDVKGVDTKVKVKEEIERLKGYMYECLRSAVSKAENGEYERMFECMGEARALYEHAKMVSVDSWHHGTIWYLLVELGKAEEITIKGIPAIFKGEIVREK